MSLIRGLCLAALLAPWSVISAPIHDIAAAGNCKKLKSLLKKDPNVAYERDQNGRTPLHYAAQEGRIAAVKLLVATTSDAAPEDARGWTPLHVAALTAQTGAAEYLLQLHANVNQRTKESSWTPLHLAIGRAHLGMAGFLIA